VEDALHCGVCKVRPEPMDLEFLRGRQMQDKGGKAPDRP
jgi:hypothetical protein